jgi:hypothetical protein
MVTALHDCRPSQAARCKQHVSSIRKKLKADPECREQILTAEVGYKFAKSKNT